MCTGCGRCLSTEDITCGLAPPELLCSANPILFPLETFPHLFHTCRPAPKYLPWFRTVLKAAKVAVHILGLLSAEARASRLSFADVVKRLAELAEGDSAFISKKVC